MTFTDDDMKRLKENMFNLEYSPNIAKIGLSPEKVMALLDRLEAAENLIRLSGTHIPNALITRERETAVWAWRKACGK